MKKLFFTLLCTLSVATHCNTLEKTEHRGILTPHAREMIRRIDTRAGQALVVGNTLLWSGVGIGIGSVVIPVCGGAVLAALCGAHIYNQRQKLAEEKQSQTIIAPKDVSAII